MLGLKNVVVIDNWTFSSIVGKTLDIWITLDIVSIYVKKNWPGRPVEDEYNADDDVGLKT